MHTWNIILNMIGCATFLTMSGQLMGGELTPFRLPSESQSYTVRQTQTTIDHGDDYYETFAQKAQNISQEGKNKLVGELSTKQKAAEDKKQFDEAEHYFKLKKILSTGSAK